MLRAIALVASLALFTTVNGAAVSAAEIERVLGPEVGQTTILVRGPIEEGDDDQFFEVAELSPSAIVYLESPGGSVPAGISIASEIALRGYTTLVLDGPGCHSICAVMWVAGVRRYMSPEADISVHAAYRMRSDANGGVEATESGMANAQIGAFLNEIGLSADAIRYFTFAGPSEELLSITPEIAQLLSIDVFIQTTTKTFTPAERPTPRRITRQVSEYSGLASYCTSLFQVDGAIWESEVRMILEQGHEMFGGETFVPLLGEYVEATKMAIHDQGFVRWCLSAEQNLREDGLQTGIDGPSYDCSKSSTPTEFAICGSPDLWAVDRAMAGLYFFFRENADSDRSQEFLSSQRSWLARRDECAGDLACLNERYSSRLFDFGA